MSHDEIHITVCEQPADTTDLLIAELAWASFRAASKAAEERRLRDAKAAEAAWQSFEAARVTRG